MPDFRWIGERIGMQNTLKEERVFLNVNPRAVVSANPGYCFLKAGWRRCGTTKWNKLIILEVIR